MFDDTKEVPSLELCKKLKELGYPQDGGGWYWNVYYDPFIKEVSTTLQYYWYTPDRDTYIKAPTVREFGEWLPDRINIDKEVYIYTQTLKRKSKRGYYDRKPYWAGYQSWNDSFTKDIIVAFEGETEANARAQMLIWLIEHGHVKFSEDNNGYS